MNTRQRLTLFGTGLVGLFLAATPVLAQTPAYETGNEGIPLLTRQELQDLVGPVALYPDDLLAIVLPASTYPLQVVQASRFLEDLKLDPGLEPDPDWDDSIVALVNYPEIVELLNEDLDWTWQLGEAVVAQQSDVVSAVEAFRNTAYAAGNLRSDDYQQVSRDEGVIEITPTNDDIIYVPYYEPERVVVYQPQRVYYYYERPYPVYYYPYSASHVFNHGYFWGLTTAFTIGWASDSLHVYHHSYTGHPYYGHHYRDRYWYRRPSIHTHNTIYFSSHNYVASRRHSRGDYWRSSGSRHLRYSDQRITRSTHYPNRNVRRVVANNRTHASSNRIVASNTQQRTSVRNRNDDYQRASRRASREVNERRSEPRTHREPQQQARAERRSQPQQQARAERRSQPQQQARAEQRSQPRTETRNKARKEDRGQERQSRGRDKPRRRKD